MKILILVLVCSSMLFAVPSWHTANVPLVGVAVDADTDGSGGAQLCTDHGRIYKYENTGLGNWTLLYQAPSDNYQLNTIDLENSNTGWCGGNLSGFPGNCMFRYASAHWGSWSSVPVVSQIWDMSFYDQFHGWSAGVDILYWNNTSWIVQTPGGLTGAIYYGISNAGLNFVEAVGTYGGSRIAIRFNGSTWAQDVTMPSGAGALYCIWMLSTIDGWAAGSNGLIFHYSGGVWSQVTSSSSSNWNRIWFLNSNDGWLVGDGGQIAHWNGYNWVGQVSPTTQNLYSVVFLNANDGWAFGLNGVVLHYYDDVHVQNTSLGQIKASFQ